MKIKSGRPEAHRFLVSPCWAYPPLVPGLPAQPAAVMCDKEFMWALKNGDLDEVKDYVAKVSGDARRWRDREARSAPAARQAGETLLLGAR